MHILKAIAARLPYRIQAELKRVYFARQIRRDRFATPEQEFKILHTLVGEGAWVIDIGANVGQYTKRLSELVGATGRVIAFEPMTATFALLAANVELFRFNNVSLFNAAASDRLALVGMSMPKFDSGLSNFYEAHLSDDDSGGGFSVLTVPADSICIDHKISLIKIDAEGHEASVLSGMKNLIAKFHPILIVETGSKDVVADLEAAGYTSSRSPGSANVIFRPI